MPTDLHAHVVPSALLARLRRGPVGGVSLAQVLGGPGHGDAQPDVDGPIALEVGGRGVVAGPAALAGAERRLAAMDAAGMRRQVLSCWIELLATRLTPGEARRWSAAVNEDLAAEVAADPVRLDAVGTVPLQDPEGAVAELRRAVGELGLAGVELPTTVAGAELADLPLEAFWAEAEALRAVVLLHPVEPVGAARMGEGGLVDLIGSPAETATAVGHLLRSGVLDRHPDLRLVLVHGGGVLPWLVGRARAVGQARGDRFLEELPRYLRQLHHDSLVHDPRVLRLLVEVVGADRVVLGTDWPFPHGEADPVGMARTALSGDAVAIESVLRGTAERLLADVRRPAR